MPFKKGQSGNPGGRPKENAEVKSLARKHGVEAIEKLVELMRGEDERLSLAAAQTLLDRGYGKPHQSMDVGHYDIPAEQMEDGELERIAAGGRERASKPKGGPEKPAKVH